MFLTKCFFADILNYAVRVGAPRRYHYVDSTTKEKYTICPSRLPGVYPCPRCQKIYSYKNNLMRHIRVECGKEPNRNCPYCTYKSKHKGDMIRHIKTRHTNIFVPSDLS